MTLQHGLQQHTVLVTQHFGPQQQQSQQQGSQQEQQQGSQQHGSQHEPQPQPQPHPQPQPQPQPHPHPQPGILIILNEYINNSQIHAFIQQKANECRELLKKYNNKNIHHIEINLNKLTDQLSNIVKKNDLNELNEKLKELE
ncbi:unnamed protein product [Adineta steineri]|uniref:Uncharacterized protein n=1 Tax=Adineta steineri TaxID=433720 RepID=A0A819QR08_9BILA|nr:unnamed protein product [Adineta steineri]